LAWLAMLGVDFFLHGGLLARLYLRESPFLLPPQEAFRRIPVGYLAFALLAVLLLWLMRRLEARTARAGFALGLQLGLLAWGALVLGLASITTADLDLLAGWWIGQSLELGIAGAVAGYGLAQQNIRRLAVLVIGMVLLLAIATILMQSLGLAPAARI
jgi:hypothetical protein